MADKKADQYYTRPPKLGKWEGFKVFLWNPETSQFLGRTGSSWGKILLFYLIFYAVLIGFFAAMLAVFYQTLDDTTPKWQGDNSLIGSNP
ncbi:Na K-ATPase domain containing protein, partial [Asbolus verrucosus]